MTARSGRFCPTIGAFYIVVVVVVVVGGGGGVGSGGVNRRQFDVVVGWLMEVSMA